MISNVPYYAMIASHIKPFSISEQPEEYDPQNGLLLGKDLDFMFDQGYITVDQCGRVIPSSQLDNEIVKYHRLDNIVLDRRLLTEERKNYLLYHQTNIFKR